MKAWFLLTAFFMLMITAGAAHAQPSLLEKALSPIFIFNDQSHEFTFQYDWWLRSYLPAGKYVLTSNLASLAEHRLQGYQILLIEMHTSGLPFTAQEIALIERFVREGGGLFLIGNGYFWEQRHVNENYPLNQLANCFGFEFAPAKAAGQLRPVKHAITAEIMAFAQKESGDRQAGAGTLKVSARNAESLVADEKGIPVLACRKYGAGRLMVAAEFNLLSPEPLGRPLRNEKLIQNIFAWLSEGTKPWQNAMPDTAVWADPEGTRILPENKLTIGKVKYYFAESLGAKAEFIHAMFPRIFVRLDSLTGVQPIFDFTVILLASGGGGYAGGDEIGIGCLAEESYLVRVIAHELTHSWVNPGPLPHYFNEAWASLLAIRIATQLGYAEKARAERESFRQAFEKADPEANQLDLNNPPKAEAGIPACTGKAMGIAEKLEQKYGEDFLKRFFVTKRKVWQKPEQLTMAEFIEVLSAAVGEDLRAFFSESGTSY